MGMCDSRYTILYFLDYGKSFGGAVNTLIQQAILMKQEGHKIVMFFSDYIGAELSDECKKICLKADLEYKWTTYHISSRIEDIDIVCIDRNYEKVKNKIISYKPDILHSVQLNPCVELVGRELGIPHIMNIYPLLPDFFSIAYLNIFAHYHLCDSWYYAQRWKKYLKTDSLCIRTVVNKKKSKKNIDPDEILKFICVGSIYKGKNQLTVIKAFHKALQYGMQGILTLCGYADGEYGNECISYIEDNDLQNKVLVKGFCADMSEEYLKNDVLICGSTRESYPNAISEALAYGLIIVSTPVGGVPEVIEDGENGYLTRDYTEEALYEKIIQVQKEVKYGKAEMVLAKARDTFLKNHSTQAVKGYLTQYYRYVSEDYKQRQNIENKRGLVDICRVRSVFKFMLESYDKNEHQLKESDKVAKKLWYLYHIMNIVKEASARGKELYIWGAGSYGAVVKEMVEVFLPEIQIKGFIDSKKSGAFGEYVIYHPEEIWERNNVIIFIAVVRGQNEIRKLLEQRKMVYNKDYFILVARSW